MTMRSPSQQPLGQEMRLLPERTGYGEPSSATPLGAASNSSNSRMPDAEQA